MSGSGSGGGVIVIKSTRTILTPWRDVRDQFMGPRFSEFVPSLCCAHEWIVTDLGECCAKCPARCRRVDGKIVEYTANDMARRM